MLRIYRAAFSGLSRDLWLLATVTLVNRSGTMVLPFIALYLTSERGLDADAAGRLVALYGFGAALGGYLGGRLSDRIGSIRTQQASLGLGGLCYLVLSSLTDRLAIAVALFVTGVIVESFRPAVMSSFAKRTDGSNRAQAFAFLRLAANLGLGIGPAVGGFLALYDYHWLFYADASTCWLGVLLLTSLRRRAPRDATADVAKARREGPESPKALSPFRDVPFLALLALVTVMASVLFQIFSTFPLYLKEHVGYHEDAIGYLLSLNALVIVAFEMVLIHLVRGRDPMQLIGVGAFFLCLGFAGTPLGASLPWLAFTVAVWTFGEMLALPILNVVVAERASPSVQGEYMGLYTTAFATAFITAPFLGTLVYERLGPTVLWYGIGALGLLLWPAALALRSRLLPR